MTTQQAVIKFKKPAKLDKSKINEKRKILEEAAKQLKAEFFGLDDIIDKVIKSVQAWYIFPEMINRPVIINLWGMTGVGKTALVRRLVSLLDFSDKFVEIQMDGGSITSQWSASSISSILSSSQVEEGQPGILLLDEIQRFKTVDETGSDVKLERFHDVWTLLSDGKFSADASMFSEIEMMIAYQQYNEDNKNSEDSKKKKVVSENGELGLAVEDQEVVPEKKRAFHLYPYEARNLKKVLRLTETVSEIMAWDTHKIMEVLDGMRTARVSWEIDYTKLIIFVSGNLDDAFTGATSTDDCDTDADFYHEQTKKITSTEIKNRLRRKFRPEQISRLGNNHIIYPSMTKLSYERLIEHTCQSYLTEMEEMSGIHFILNENVRQEIYNNSVYPTQGTRPVFSSIHMIFSSILVDITFWCVENDIKTASLSMTPDLKFINAESKNKSELFPISLELNDKRQKTTLNTKTLVAVHETGHALVYARLNKLAPLEIKINTASYQGGYMLPAPGTILTKQGFKNRICILMAGMAAEENIFGKEDRSSGSHSDIAGATALASDYVRQYGFGGTLGAIDAPKEGTNFITDLDGTNFEVENIIRAEFNRAKSLIKADMDILKIVVNKLIETSVITKPEFITLVGELMPINENDEPTNYVDVWSEVNS